MALRSTSSVETTPTASRLPNDVTLLHSRAQNLVTETWNDVSKLEPLLVGSIQACFPTLRSRSSHHINALGTSQTSTKPESTVYAVYAQQLILEARTHVYRNRPAHNYKEWICALADTMCKCVVHVDDTPDLDPEESTNLEIGYVLAGLLVDLYALDMTMDSQFESRGITPSDPCFSTMKPMLDVAMMWGSNTILPGIRSGLTSHLTRWLQTCLSDSISSAFELELCRKLDRLEPFVRLCVVNDKHSRFGPLRSLLCTVVSLSGPQASSRLGSILLDVPLDSSKLSNPMYPIIRLDHLFPSIAPFALQLGSKRKLSMASIASSSALHVLVPTDQIVFLDMISLCSPHKQLHIPILGYCLRTAVLLFASGCVQPAECLLDRVHSQNLLVAVSQLSHAENSAYLIMIATGCWRLSRQGLSDYAYSLLLQFLNKVYHISDKSISVEVLPPAASMMLVVLLAISAVRSDTSNDSLDLYAASLVPWLRNRSSKFSVEEEPAEIANSKGLAQLSSFCSFVAAPQASTAILYTSVLIQSWFSSKSTALKGLIDSAFGGDQAECSFQDDVHGLCVTSLLYHPDTAIRRAACMSLSGQTGNIDLEGDQARSKLETIAWNPNKWSVASGLILLPIVLDRLNLETDGQLTKVLLDCMTGMATDGMSAMLILRTMDQLVACRRSGILTEAACLARHGEIVARLPLATFDKFSSMIEKMVLGFSSIDPMIRLAALSCVDKIIGRRPSRGIDFVPFLQATLVYAASHPTLLNESGACLALHALYTLCHEGVLDSTKALRVVFKIYKPDPISLKCHTYPIRCGMLKLLASGSELAASTKPKKREVGDLTLASLRTLCAGFDPFKSEKAESLMVQDVLHASESLLEYRDVDILTFLSREELESAPQLSEELKMRNDTLCSEWITKVVLVRASWLTHLEDMVQNTRPFSTCLDTLLGRLFKESWKIRPRGKYVADQLSKLRVASAMLKQSRQEEANSTGLLVAQELANVIRKFPIGLIRTVMQYSPWLLTSALSIDGCADVIPRLRVPLGLVSLVLMNEASSYVGNFPWADFLTSLFMKWIDLKPEQGTDSELRTSILVQAVRSLACLSSAENMLDAQTMHDRLLTESILGKLPDEAMCCLPRISQGKDVNLLRHVLDRLLVIEAHTEEKPKTSSFLKHASQVFGSLDSTDPKFSSWTSDYYRMTDSVIQCVMASSASVWSWKSVLKSLAHLICQFSEVDIAKLLFLPNKGVFSQLPILLLRCYFARESVVSKVSTSTLLIPVFHSLLECPYYEWEQFLSDNSALLDLVSVLESVLGSCIRRQEEHAPAKQGAAIGGSGVLDMSSSSNTVSRYELWKRMLESSVQIIQKPEPASLTERSIIFNWCAYVVVSMASSLFSMPALSLSNIGETDRLTMDPVSTSFPSHRLWIPVLRYMEDPEVSCTNLARDVCRMVLSTQQNAAAAAAAAILD